MLDCAQTLKDFLEANWTEEDPALEDLKWTVRFGFDVKAQCPQILLDDNVPEVRPKIVHISATLMRVEHVTEITIFVRPVRYMAADIATANATFKNMQSEVEGLLFGNRYQINNLADIKLGEWSYVDRRAGEPVYFEAHLKVTCIYFIDGTDYTREMFPYIFLA